jgi:taurine dioxygenase
MLTIEPTGAVLGAVAHGIDLAQPLSERDLGQVLLALGRHGVLRFPGQHLGLGELKRFSEQFGEIQGPATRGKDMTREYPEIDILSNLKKDGQYVGSPDAGQDWHTDMTYREVPGFVNVLYGIRIPQRDGRSLGGTEFANVHRAYEALPEEIKKRLDGMTATHNIEKFWEHMRRVHNSPRPPMTDEQRRRRPPVVHPVFLDPPDHRPQSALLQPRLRRADQRTAASRKRRDARVSVRAPAAVAIPLDQCLGGKRPVDLGPSRHAAPALADYGPDEIRLIRRCQVMATKVFDPEFLRPARELANAEPA